MTLHILYFRQCCARCHNVVSFSHIVHIVCILYLFGLNIYVALSLVYNTWTGAVITSFLIYNFRVPYNNNNNNNNAGTRHRGTIKNKDRIAATMYPLGTWFVPGMCVCGYPA